MRYNEIALTKEMYDIPNKTLSDILTELDPDSGYNELNDLRGLDAYERQLKRFDIKVNGNKCDQVNKFFQSDKSLILFPEYIRRMIRNGINNALIIPYISAVEVCLPDAEKRSQYTCIVDIDDTYQTLIQRANLTDFVKEFACSYHLIRQLNIETFGVILKNIGFAIARVINDRCVTYIKNKNLCNPTAYLRRFISIKKITIDSLIGFINSVETNITTIICDPKTYNKIIIFPEIINHITLDKIVHNDIVKTPLGITIIKSNALSNEIIGVDKTTGLEISYESKDIVNSNELMSTDFGKISYSIKIGFNKIAEDSFARAIIEEK